MGGCEALAGAGYRGLLCLPLRARGRTIGVLEMLAGNVRIYSDVELSLARAIAEIALTPGRGPLQPLYIRKTEAELNLPRR